MRNKSLSQHGFAHFILPIIVVLTISAVGIFAMVASRADAKPKEDIQGARGFLRLYSDGGRYDRAAIYAFQIGTSQPVYDGTEVCNGQKVYGTKITVKLSANKPKDVRCSAANFIVVFLKQGQEVPASPNGVSYTAAAVQPGLCTYVRESGIIRSERVIKKKCPASTSGDAVFAKQAVVLTAQAIPREVVAGQEFTREFTVSLVNKGQLSRKECAGKIHREASGKPTANITNDFPLRYDRTRNVCLYSITDVARIGTPRPETISSVVTFPGNKYLEPAKTTYEYTVIPANGSFKTR